MKRNVVFLMKLLLFIFLFILSAGTQAQTTKSDTIDPKQKREFQTQGEQEDYWAEQIFKENYSRQTYKKFAGKITVSKKNHITFEKRTLELLYTSEDLKPIFTEGIFYPGLIDSSDSLKISDFHELKSLSTTPTVRRFKFWLFRKWMANPQVYFIELTNTSANDSTDLSSFIKGAVLTFVKDAWIVI
jgi:hypothetical protein